MAITFVGSHVGTHAATSAQTVNFSNLKDASGATPTVQAGDIVFVAVENASTVNRTTAGGADVLVPSGYTGVLTHDYRNDSNDSNFRASYKVMGSTPDTSVAIPASNATTAGVGYVIYVFRGVDNTTPLDVSAVAAGAINTGVANAAAITPSTAGAWITVFAGAAVTAGLAFTNPTNMDATTNYFRSATLTTTTNDPVIGGAIYSGWTSGSFDPAAFGGSQSSPTGSWSAVTIALRPAPTTVTHDTTGALVGPGSTLAGSAVRTRTHTTTGALTGQGSSLAGTAARTRVHSATGALTGPGAAIAGTANRTRVHTTSGVLTGQGAILTGAATRFRAFATSGALVGNGAALSGAADRIGGFTTHDATGALVGPGASISGTAARSRIHTATGALVGQGATLAGSAKRFRAFGSTGALVGPSSAISGTASRTRFHATTGALVGAGAVISGIASRVGAPIVHDTSGVLIGPGAIVSGSAALGGGHPIGRPQNLAPVSVGRMMCR